MDEIFRQTAKVFLEQHKGMQQKSMNKTFKNFGLGKYQEQTVFEIPLN